MNARWMIWRVVKAGYGTLTEVAERWTLRALYEAHVVLDIQEDAEIESHLNADRK